MPVKAVIENHVFNLLDKMLLKGRRSLELALNVLVRWYTQGQKYRAPISWYKVTVSAEDVPRAVSAIIQYEFCALFNAAGDPENAAMFSTQVLNTGAELYFSPGARRIAKSLLKQYGGVPCEKPSCAIYLMVGHPAAKVKLI